MNNNRHNCTLLSFPPCTNTLDLSRCKNEKTGVYVYTEMKGLPIVNYCDKCYSPYYSILSVNNNSIMSTHVRVSRCKHSMCITPYLKAEDIAVLCPPH